MLDTPFADSQARRMGRKDETRQAILFCASVLVFNHPLANQFRALEEDEIMFLDSIRERQEAEERQRREMDGEEVKNFKEYVVSQIPIIPIPQCLLPAEQSPLVRALLIILSLRFLGIQHRLL